jgi:hypothetical protein
LTDLRFTKEIKMRAKPKKNKALLSICRCFFCFVAKVTKILAKKLHILAKRLRKE